MGQALPHDHGGVLYTACDPSEAPGLTRVLALAFSHDDAPAVPVGLTPAEFADFVALVASPGATQVGKGRSRATRQS